MSGPQIVYITSHQFKDNVIVKNAVRNNTLINA